MHTRISYKIFYTGVHHETQFTERYRKNETILGK